MTDPTEAPTPAAPTAAPTPAAPTAASMAPGKSASIGLLESDIADLAQRAVVAHRATAQHFEREYSRLSKDRDEDRRRLAGLKSEVAEAESQAKEAAALVEGMTAGIAYQRSEADTLEAAGDHAGAAEARENVDILEARIRAYTERVRIAGDEVLRLRTAINSTEAEVAAGNTAMTSLEETSRAAEAAADVLDAKGALLAESLTHAVELERLTDEAHRLDAEGKTTEAQAARAAADREATVAVEKLNAASALVVDDKALAAVPGAVPTAPTPDWGPDAEPEPTPPPTVPESTTPTPAPTVPAPPTVVDPSPPTPTVDPTFPGDSTDPAPAPPTSGPGPVTTDPRPIASLTDAGELRARAATLRHDVLETYERDATRVEIERDDAERRAHSADQEAKAADAQIARERKVVTTTRAALDAEDAKIAKLEENQEATKATEATERRAELQQRLETATVRLDRATEAAIDLRQEAATNTARVTELDAYRQELVDQVHRSNRALDAMEVKADHMTAGDALTAQSEQATVRAEALRAEGKTAEAAKADAEATVLADQARARLGQVDKVVIDEKLLVPVVATPTPNVPTPPPTSSAGTPSSPTPSPPAPVADPPPGSAPSVVLAHRAAAARAALTEHTGEEKIRIDVARDEAARKAWALEQETKSAVQQTADVDAAVTHARAVIGNVQVEIAKAEAAGNPEEVERLNERLDAYQTQLEVNLARREDVSADASRLRIETAKQQAEVTRLDAESTATTARATGAEKAVDAMEDKAALLDAAEGYEESAALVETEGQRLMLEGKIDEAEEQLTYAKDMRALAKESFDKAAAIVVNDRAIDSALPAGTRPSLPAQPVSDPTFDSALVAPTTTAADPIAAGGLETTPGPGAHDDDPTFGEDLLGDIAAPPPADSTAVAAEPMGENGVATAAPRDDDAFDSSLGAVDPTFADDAAEAIGAAVDVGVDTGSSFTADAEPAGVGTDAYAVADDGPAYDDAADPLA